MTSWSENLRLELVKDRTMTDAHLQLSSLRTIGIAKSKVLSTELKSN